MTRSAANRDADSLLYEFVAPLDRAPAAAALDAGCQFMQTHVVDGHVYAIDQHRVIREAGPFKDQPIFAPYFWNGYLDGTYDDEYWDDCEHVIVFDITDDDRCDYPELTGASRVYIRHDHDGRIVAHLDPKALN